MKRVPKKSLQRATVGVHYALLASVKEGDLFELGVPFAFAPTQPLTWLCTEVITESDGRLRVQLRLSFRGALLRELRAVLDPQHETVEWGAA